MSSIPQDKRIILSSIPNNFLYSIGTEPCVINEGISERDSTPPNDSAKIKH